MRTLFLALALSPAAVGTAIAKDVMLNANTPFSESSVIREAVKNECQLQSKLPEFVKSYAESNGINVVFSDKKPTAGSGQVLLLEIVAVQGAGGGAWSGAKSVQVRGKLFDNGKQTGDFMASRYSGGGMFAGYKGTCSILGRCVKTLGKDIATWLQNPSKNAQLGDF